DSYGILIFEKLPAHWLLFLFSNDAKLDRGVSGKDVVGVNGIFYYFSEYQMIKIPLKNKFEW
ncbi:hypothetical protein, partial [Thomasclavelia cocleata]|uniref:hypothetical protein n=1 Tax=Thomasclavelia cocleata TaxID=69824 RepID=UPI0025A0A8F8